MLSQKKTTTQQQQQQTTTLGDELVLVFFSILPNELNGRMNISKEEASELENRAASWNTVENFKEENKSLRTGKTDLEVRPFTVGVPAGPNE